MGRPGLFMDNQSIRTGEKDLLCTIGVSVGVTAPSSSGASDGTASANISGLIGTASYLWSTGATTPSIIGLVDGLYSVTVTDSNKALCTATADGYVLDPAAVPVPTCNLVLTGITPTHETAFGDADGQALAVVTGNVGALNFEWTDSLGGKQFVNPAINLPAGPVGLAVTDSGVGATCLESGVTTINAGYAMMLQSKKDVDTLFSAVYTGVNMLRWTDGTQTLYGDSVTFNFTTTAVKTIYLYVDDAETITGIGSLTSSKVSGDVNLSPLSGYAGTLSVTGNSELETLLLPISSNVIDNVNLSNNDMVLSLDLSVMSALEGTVSTNGSAVLNTLILGTSSGVFDLINAHTCDLSYIDFSGLPNCLGAVGSRIATYSNNKTAAEVDQETVEIAATRALLGVLAGQTYATHGSNAGPTDGSVTGYDGIKGKDDLIADGVGVTTS